MQSDSFMNMPPVQYPVEPAAHQRKKSRTWLWILLGVAAVPMLIFLAVLVAVVFAFNSVTGIKRGTDLAVDESPVVREIWSYGDGDVKVVRIPLKGVLFEEDRRGFFSSPGPVEQALKQIRAATEDSSVRAIILEIDSPGGAITACDLIHFALMEFKRRSDGRVVIALLGDMAASGGFYVASAADYIIAHPTTVTGSIGVIISSLNVKGLGDRYGVKLNTVKSGANKDIMSPFGDLTDEQRKLLQQVVDEMYERFVSLIVAGRTNASPDAIRSISDGRLFSSKTALDNKLVDQIGYWDDAVDSACRLLEVDGVKVVKYGEEFSLASLLEAKGGDMPLSARTVAEAVSPRVLCLWPGTL